MTILITISNAITFKGDESPVITIGTIRQQDNIVESVQDNGRGIAKTEMGKIFEMYDRLNRDMEGNGIGLYLAKKVIDAAEGNSVVQSELGKGCKFIIYSKP